MLKYALYQRQGPHPSLTKQCKHFSSNPPFPKGKATFGGLIIFPTNQKLRTTEQLLLFIIHKCALFRKCAANAPAYISRRRPRRHVPRPRGYGGGVNAALKDRLRVAAAFGSNHTVTLSPGRRMCSGSLPSSACRISDTSTGPVPGGKESSKWSSSMAFGFRRSTIFIPGVSRSLAPW